MDTTTTATKTLTIAEFADWLGAQLHAARLIGVRVWHGDTCHRVYRGEDYVTVTVRDEWYGGPLTRITGRDRGFVAALSDACERVIGFSLSGGTVTISI